MMNSGRQSPVLAIDLASDAVFRFRMKWNNHPGAESFEDWWPEWVP